MLVKSYYTKRGNFITRRVGGGGANHYGWKRHYRLFGGFISSWPLRLTVTIIFLTFSNVFLLTARRNLNDAASIISKPN